MTGGQAATPPRSAIHHAWAWVKRWPILTWALVAGLVLLVLGLAEVEYDSMPFGLLVITDGLWAWMYWLPSELLFELNCGTAMPNHEFLSVLLGMPLAFMADIILRLIRRRVAGAHER
jgi:hypothetical protein